MRKRDSEKALLGAVGAIDRALGNYDAENVDLVLNEETGWLDVMYHSDRHSFPIQMNVANPDAFTEEDKSTLIAELDKRHVGYCW